MSSSISTKLEVQPIATKTKILKQRKADAKKFLHPGRFYMTNAGFPRELERSNEEYTKSPLRSYGTLRLGPLDSERKLLGVSTNTTIRHIKEGQKQLNYKRPCYLVEYDKSTNQGVIFLMTSKVPENDNQHRFASVHSRSPLYKLQSGSLETVPRKSFPQRMSYLNFSHPLQVQFAYFSSFPESKLGRIELNKILCDRCEPPLVAIANFLMQPSNNGPKESFVVLHKKSELLFWEKHMEYHRSRSGQLRSKDDSGGDEPHDDSGGDEPDDDRSGDEPDDDRSGDEPYDDSHGDEPNDGGPSTSGAGPSTSGDGPNTCGVGSNRGGLSSWIAEDAPWGRGGLSSWIAEDAPWGQVGDQRIGIDIPLVMEDMCPDSDEEMDLEDSMNNLDADDAPWGCVGDHRIGIDIPLVIEDIYSDPGEEMDLESDEELQEVDNIVNVDKLESSDHKGITTWPNSNERDSSCSYTIPKPYFTIHVPFGEQYVLLDHDHLAGKWRWTLNTHNIFHKVESIEGLSYEHPDFSITEKSDRVRRIFNWHTKEYTILPQPPYEHLDFRDVIVGMIVDTSVWPYAFKVIEGSEMGTMIYDSTPHYWSYHQPPFWSGLFKNNSHRNASVASCKGVAFVVDLVDRIVLYDAKKDKWDYIEDPADLPEEKLCGIGSWDDRIFSCTVSMWENAIAISIQELVDMDTAKLEWKEFAVMTGEMCSWLKGGMEGNRLSTIDVSFYSENLLLWVSALSIWSFSFERPVLYNLAQKTWKKLELPCHPWTVHMPRSLMMKSKLEEDEIMDKGHKTALEVDEDMDKGHMTWMEHQHLPLTDPRSGNLKLKWALAENMGKGKGTQS